MPYEDRTHIAIPTETKVAVEEAKEKLGLTYREFLERAAKELPS